MQGTVAAPYAQEQERSNRNVLPTTQVSEWRSLIAILGLFFAIGLWYSLTTPPFETPDEIHHYAFARHLAAGYGLPVQNPDVEEAWSHEGSQAPLYYWLVGRLTAGIDQSDFDQLNVPNLRANIGDPLFPGNKNFMLYSAQPHPLQGSNLALHIGRWVSLLLGGLTLWFTYRIAQLALADYPAIASAWPLSLPLLAVIWVATIPQFAFISAACSNDSMVIVTSAATIYWLARLVTNATHRSIRFMEWIVLGICIGLAALSKLQGLGLLPLVGCATLIIARLRHNWRVPFQALLPVVLPALAIAGWWYWRNYSLYGDLFGVSHLLSNNGLRGDAITWDSFWGEFRGLRYSFWGIFGWFNILLPAAVYPFFDGVTLVALAGVPVAWWSSRAKRREQPAAWVRLLLLSWLLISVALLIYWLNRATSSQGRLFFPAISAFAIFLVWGLHSWLRGLPHRVQPALWLLMPSVMLGCSLFALIFLLPASYRAPRPVAAIPSSAQPLDVVYGAQDRLYLLALELPSARFRQGESVPVTLYLQAREPIQADYQLFIQLLDEQGREVGNLTTHPGWGRNPTTLWQPGAIYADHYPVLIQRTVDGTAPLLARVYIGFVDPQTEESGRLPILAQTSEGTPIKDGPFLGYVAISPSQPPTVTLDQMSPIETQFGQVIQLTAADFPTQVSLETTTPITATLVWDAIGTPATDYTAFVHLLDDAGQRVSGFDQAPALRFPTRYWQPGDRIVSEVVLTPPSIPGNYTLWVGLYETGSDGSLLLPITAAAGFTTGDGRVQIGQIAIEP
ncbi:MAG: hypothetical protein KF832_18315 [Caldilineaceae bacterium]|nr:hypothetical protein [Caldilineaceae bacterium]